MSLFKSIFTIPNRIVNVILRNGNVTPFSITITEIDNDLTVENCLYGFSIRGIGKSSGSLCNYVETKELYFNNLHTLPCLFSRLLRQKASAMPASPAFFSLHSKKHPSEIAQVIFRQFLRNCTFHSSGIARKMQKYNSLEMGSFSDSFSHSLVFVVL